MAGTVDLAVEVERRISLLTDAELVAMLRDRPGDYEPRALDLGRAELSRRGLPPLEVVMLRAQNAAVAAEVERRFQQDIPLWVPFLLILLTPLSLVLFPLYFAVARSLDRHGDARTAILLRLFGKMAIVVDVCFAAFFVVAYFESGR